MDFLSPGSRSYVNNLVHNSIKAGHILKNGSAHRTVGIPIEELRIAVSTGHDITSAFEVKVEVVEPGGP